MRSQQFGRPSPRAYRLLGSLLTLGLLLGAAPAQAGTRTQASAGNGAKRSKRGSSARARKKVEGHAVFEGQLRREPLERPSGELFLHDIARNESVRVNIYLPDGSYDPEAVAQVSHLLRCKRTGEERDIEPRLMTILSHVYDKFRRRIEVVSGYRNQQRTTSFHYQGSATDIRVPGVHINKIRKFLTTIDTGGMGIGIYPKVGFVHVDVRPPPSYRWVDYSSSDPDDPGRRPPRGWKKLRS